MRSSAEVLTQVGAQKQGSHHRDDGDDRRYATKREESFLGDLFG